MNCHICQSSCECISRDQLSDHGFVYDLYRCHICGFESKLNSESIEDIYKFVYDENSFINKRLGKFKKGSNPERKYLKAIMDQYANRGIKLLEIGPGSGATLSYAKEKNIVTASLDVSEKNNLYYENECDVDYVFNDINDIQNNFYDAVVMTHVIEHVTNPSEMIAAITKKIKSGGDIIISTPNSNAIFKHIFGVKWWPYLIDDHVSFFNLQHIEKLLMANGFSTINKYTYGSNMIHSLNSYLKRNKKKPSRLKPKEAPQDSSESPEHLKSLRKMIMSITDVLMAPCAWMGMGYEIVYIGKKNEFDS